MEKNIVKTKKSNDEVWVDLSNLPLRKTKYIKYNYSLIKDMEDIPVPFSYKGLEGTLYLTFITKTPEATYKYKFKNEEGTITIGSLNRVALDRVTYKERKKQGLIKRFNGKRKVYLDNLPKLNNYIHYGTFTYNIDFKNSVGLSFSYEFEDKKDKLKIIDYFNKENNKGNVIEYVRVEDTKGQTYLYNALNIIIGNLQRVAEEFNYPYNKGDIVGKFTVKDNTTTEVITKDGKVDITRLTVLQCNECGLIKRVPSHRISQKAQSSCSDCNAMKKSLKELNKHRSKGESMVEQVLLQNGIKYEAERSFDWSERKRYDFYLPDFNGGTIIEVHGVQHYLEQNEGQRFHLTLEENKKNDKWKKDKVLEQDLNYIEIDVRESDFDYIKESIINSTLPTVDIDWTSVYKYMENGFINKIIDMYDNGYSNKEMAEKLNVSSGLIQTRLKKLSQMQIINYTPYDYNIKQLEEKLERLKKERQEYLDKIRDQD